MKISFLIARLTPPALLLVLLATATGCHSYHIDVTVENRSGAAVQLLEVDYPSASFGVDSLAAGADFHYRIQLRGSSAVKVQYTAADGGEVQAVGPVLVERQQGQLQIMLLPARKIVISPSLLPSN